MGFWSSLTGGDAPPPAGTLDDAWRMLQAGAVNDGRKLLLAICRANPSNRAAHVLGVFELTRPPVDQPNRHKLLNTLDSQPAQHDFVLPFLTVLQYSADGYQRAYGSFMIGSWAALHGAPPADPHVAAMMLYTRVLMSDVLIQVSLPPASGAIDSIIVNFAAQGVTQLMLRDARAIATLQSGLDAKTLSFAAYSRIAGREFSPQEHSALCTRIALECHIGLGLAHRDSGRKDQARAAFQAALAIASAHQPKPGREIDPDPATLEDAAIWRSPVPALQLLLREP